MLKDKAAIKEVLQGVFREVFDDTSIEIHDAMTAADIEEWDSLTHILLIVAIEKKIKLKFNTGEVVGLKNVGEMIELLAKKLSA